MDDEGQNGRLEMMESLNLEENESQSAAMSSAMPSSIPSFQQVSLNPTESIVPDPTIRSEQVTSAMIDHPEQMVSENQMGMIIVNEESVNNQIEQDTTPIGDNLQYDPRLLYHNPELQSSSIIIEDETPEHQNVNETYSQHEYSKRPRTAYNFFSKDYFGKMKNADSMRSSTDIIKELSSKWKSLSEEERRPYYESSREDKKRYDLHCSTIQQEKEQAGIPVFSKTREKQSYIYEAVVKHDPAKFVTGLMICNGDNLQKTSSVLQQIREQLLRIMYSQKPSNEIDFNQASFENHPFPSISYQNNYYPVQLISTYPMNTEPANILSYQQGVHQVQEEHHDIPQTTKKYVCDYEGCGQSFETSSGLYKHKQKHINPVTVYSCSYEGCNKQFKTKYGLSLHQRNKHEIEKPIVCTYCKRGFVRKSDLELHIRRTHDNSKPYMCDMPGCDKRFSSQFELTRHKKTHNSISFVC